MSTMPLAQIHGRNQCRVDRVPRPTAGPDDVIIKVQLCGICGSDLAYIRGGGLLGPGQAMPIGHELVGTVFELGKNVRHLQRGQRVVVNPEGAGNRIGNGGPEGGFAPYLRVRNVAADRAAVITLPASLSPEQGAMVEPLSVAMHAVHQGGVLASDKAVIFGAGPVGLGILLVLKYYGLSNIVVSDLSERRLAVAQSLGAKVHRGTSDVAAFLSQQHGVAEIAGLGPMPATDIFFEATGAAAVFTQITQLAQRGARAVVVGVHQSPVELDLVNVLMRELRIVGAMAYPTEFPQVISMLESGSVDISPLITQRYPLSRFDQAIARASDTETAIKVMVDCQV